MKIKERKENSERANRDLRGVKRREVVKRKRERVGDSIEVN